MGVLARGPWGVAEPLPARCLFGLGLVERLAASVAAMKEAERVSWPDLASDGRR